MYQSFPIDFQFAAKTDWLTLIAATITSVNALARNNAFGELII
jgi:hypothetical protein